MIKNASERATGRVSKPMTLKANIVSNTMAHKLEDFPSLKQLVRTQIVEVGDILHSMIEAVDTLGKRVDTLEASITSTWAAITAMQRAAGKERAVAWLRVITDELERRAVATAQRQLRRAVILRGACTFLAIKLDTELYAVANDVYNACLPTDSAEAKRVRDARMRSSNGTHYALGDGVSIADLLAMNKLARCERHQFGWPAISSLQAMLESRHVVPPLGDDDVEVEASDRELFKLEALTPAERAEYNRRHHTWHRGCTQTI